MNNCTRLIENIEGLLDTSAALDEETMGNLATEYIDACNELNEELKLCAKELHSGNPSEAIRLCDALRVLDNYQLLNMENRADWVASVEMIMDVPVPDLLSRLAEELFFCRDEQLAQSNLLNKHRLMAWRKDPLKDRLKVLRELYLLNPNNEGWLDDLKQWETVRCKEIMSHDIDQISTEEELSQLLDELAPENMHISIPAALSKRIKQLQNEFLQKKIEAQKVQLDFEMRSKLDNIQTLLNNNDLNSVPTLFQQFNYFYSQMAAIGGYVDDDLVIYSQNLHSLYNQKIEYFKNLKLFSNSLNKFNELLQSINPGKEQLIMAYSELKRIASETNQSIPTPVTIKYQAILKQLKQNAIKSKIISFLIGSVVLIAIAAIVTGLIFILK